MANKVSILITNTDGRHFVLTNEKMSIMMACELSVNWDAVFSSPVSPYDIIILDFHNSTVSNFGLGYTLVQHCDNREQAERIVWEIRERLHAQYDRMMMIRVAKKYNLGATTLARLEMEYHDSENYEYVIEIEDA